MRTVLGCLMIGVMGLGGCVDYTGDARNGAGWAYRAGSGVEIEIRPQEVREAPDAGAPIVGTWSGEGRFVRPPVYSQRYYALEVRNDWHGGSSRRMEVRSMDEMEGLPDRDHEYDERRLTLRLERDAGALLLEGEKEGEHAAGDVRFERNDDFAALVAALAGREARTSELASLAFANVRRDDVEALRATGKTIEPTDLIRLRDQGVSGAFIRSLNATGRAFTLDEAVKLRRSGVTPEYVAGMRDAGLDVPVEELIRVHNNGVTPGYVQGLRAGDAPLPPVDEIIRLRNSGVGAKYIAELREAGYDFTTPEIVRLSQNSISASYAKGVKEAGYELDVDGLIRLRNSGVSAQYLRDLQEEGYERLSIDQVMAAKRQGLSAEFVKKLRARE